MKYFKIELKEFVESFKLKFDFLYVSLFDLVFYAVMTSALFAVGFIVTNVGEKVDAGLLASQESLLAASEIELAALYGQLQGLVIWTLIAFAVFFILLLLAWTFTRGMIYARILKKEFTKDSFKKFAGLNLVLGFALLLILIFVSILVQAGLVVLLYLSVLILLAVAYFILMIYIEFIKKNKVFASIADGLVAGVKKFKKLWLPGLLVVIIAVIVNLIASQLPKSIYFSLIVFVAYMAWARIYFINRAEKA